MNQDRNPEYFHGFFNLYYGLSMAKFITFSLALVNGYFRFIFPVIKDGNS